jgi:hypothetical protein
MTDLRDGFDPLHEVEALIRSAQDFVAVSEDLRPRVLEAARDQRTQRRARQRIGKAAALVLALGAFLALIREEAQEVSSTASGENRSPQTWFISSASNPSQEEPAWDMVDSLTELRRRQTAFFRLSL